MSTILVEARVLGKKAPVVPPWSLPVPLENQSVAYTVRLKELIERVVTHEVQAFNQRQKEQTMLAVFSKSQLNEHASEGAIRFGGRNPQSVDLDQAIETALEAFSDGLYYVFVGEDQVENLDTPVQLQEETKITFIRLVALAGG